MTHAAAVLLSQWLDKSHYQETPPEKYNERLRCLVRKLWETAKTKTSDAFLLSLDGNRLEPALEQLPWKQLCADYDSITDKERRQESLLVLLLSTLRDPVAWPTVLLTPVISTLLQHLVFGNNGSTSQASNRLSWAPSQQYLLEWMTIQLEQQHPLLDQLLDRPIVLQKTKGYRHSAASWNILISVLKHWMRVFTSKKKYVVRLMGIVMNVLGALEHLIRDCRHQQQLLLVAPDNSSEISHQRRRPRRRISLANLHGEKGEDDDEEEYDPRPRKRPRSYRNNRKEAMEATSLASPDQLRRDITQLGRLRTKSLQCLRTNRQQLGQYLKQLVCELVDSVQRVDVRQQSTGYIRLLLYLWSHDHSQSNQRDSYWEVVLSLLWDRVVEAHARQSVSDLEVSCSLLVEVLIESAHFDSGNGVQQLWKMTQRLLRYALDQPPIPTSVTSNGDNLSTMGIFLFSITHILASRGALLRQHYNSTCKLQSFLVQLSNVYEDPIRWLLPAHRSNDRLWKALQDTGVFGSEAAMPQSVENDKQSYKSNWLFHPEAGHSVRRLCGTGLWSLVAAGEDYSCSLFSTLSPVNMSISKEGSSRSHNIYLHDDVVRLFFSFLGYKRLVKIRQVCRNWKRLADEDELWKTQYRERFGLHSADATIFLSWKPLYMRKWLTQRDVRFQRDRNGWKVRVCHRVGCMHVVKTQLAWEKHQRGHESMTKKKRKSSSDKTIVG